MKQVLAVVMLFGLGAQALANAPATSPIPKPRPGATATPVVATGSAPRQSLHPKRRPQRGGAAIGEAVMAALSSPTPASVTPAAVTRSPRPMKRPSSLARPAVAASAPASRQGSVCGVNAIKGQTVAAIPGKLPGCGVANPVRVTEVSGVRLSQPAVIDCTTAKALNTWVKSGVTPAVGRLGGGVAELKIVAHYACRTRNNQPGGKISEHGKGHAVDVAGITLRNGATISVLNGWRDPVQGKVLKAMHRSACGPFGTVLGPDADRYHQDHLHVDTARYRSGSYCR